MIQVPAHFGRALFIQQEEIMNSKQKKTSIIIIASLIILVAAVLLIRNQSNNKNNTTETEETKVASYNEETLITENLVLTSLTKSTGNFPEDGSDEFLENMLCATFENKAEETLQYAKINVTIDEQVYTFEISTIPPGEMVHAYEMNKSSAPETMNEVKAEAEYVVYFQEEPSLSKKKLEITVTDGTVTVKNISEKDIDKEISIFYKNVTGETYMGGITYRLRIDGLKAGEEKSGYASHASESGTRIMFVTYGN